MKNSGQKKTVKQDNKRMTEEKTDKKEFGISLRKQLIVGFAVPIFFLIGVGVISYRNASSGMIGNYENSAINAPDMMMECLERGFSPSVANVLELANNTVKKMRELVGAVRQVIGLVSASGIRVSEAGESVSGMVDDMSAEISEIGNNITRECVKQMEEVAVGIEDMNTERRNAMSAMRRIHECSEESVKSVDSVKGTLEKQIVCAETLSSEAEGLKEHMQQLDQVIAAFKLEA